MKLPPRREYPDYYETIKKPIDIKKIVNRIEKEKVTTNNSLANKLHNVTIFST